MQLKRVENQVDLRQLWPLIVEQIRDVKAQCNELWLVEDVWAALLAQRATLYVGVKDEARVGFLISEVQWDAFATRPVLNIWIAVGPTLFAEHGAEVIDFMKATAREQGAIKVRMSSPRKGWGRAGMDKLMAPAYTVWECGVAE